MATAGDREGCQGKTQTALVFGPTFVEGASQLSLIQLPQDILKKVLEDPTTPLKFMGRDNEDAVLVTEDRTYAVRKGETSNAQLLIPSPTDMITHRAAGIEDDGKIGIVVANVMEHYELLPVRPRLRMLPELLARRPFEGPEYEEEQEMDDSTPTRLSRAELEATFQASPAELSAELLRLGALEIDGKFCLMGTRYESNLMTRFFAEAAIHEWDLAAIRPSQCWATSRDLASYPRVVLRAFFSKYKKCSMDADQPGAGGASRGGGHADMHLDEGAGVANQGDPDAERISMDVAEMALFCADDLLSGSAKLLTVDEFKFAWKTMLPAKSDENLFDLATLGGRAVLEARGAQVVVKRFRVQDLSSDVKTRFRQLFQQSPMWTKEDLIPYLNDLISPSCTHDQLLLKYTRSVRTPGSDARTYTART